MITMPQFTLDIEPSGFADVVKALENHAAYLRGYRSDGTRAARLEDLAKLLVAGKAEVVIASPKKPVGRETSATTTKLTKSA